MREIVVLALLLAGGAAQASEWQLSQSIGGGNDTDDPYGAYLGGLCQ